MMRFFSHSNFQCPRRQQQRPHQVRRTLKYTHTHTHTRQICVYANDFFLLNGLSSTRPPVGIINIPSLVGSIEKKMFEINRKRTNENVGFLVEWSSSFRSTSSVAIETATDINRTVFDVSACPIDGDSYGYPFKVENGRADLSGGPDQSGKVSL